tara:strand:+ start:148534 stop:149091 length:558 start_codon:yes stop_codon:yes gene_type:complete
MDKKVTFRFSSFKAIIIGLVASGIMLLFMQLIVSSGSFAYMNSTPVEVFLTDLNIPAQPLAMVLHLGYGTFWALLLVSIFKKRTNIKQALTMSAILWLSLMLLLAPAVGWGFFGVQGNSVIDPSAMNYIAPGNTFAVITFFAHLIYGLIIGYLLPRVAVYDFEVRKDRNKYHSLRQKRWAEQSHS